MDPSRQNILLEAHSLTEYMFSMLKPFSRMVSIVRRAMNNTDTNLVLFRILASIHAISIVIAVTASSSPYTPVENIALDCGSHGHSTAPDGRKWTSDTGSKFICSQLNASSISMASTQDSVPLVPYMTARIFTSQFTYAFPLSPGPKFLRLHFHPASYSNLDPSHAFFSVTANHYTLLHNFSAWLTAGFLNQTHFSKEYCVWVSSEQLLNLTFAPVAGAFAFVNGIEVVSMPTDLYLKGEDISMAGQSQPFTINNGTALEMVYRLNVDGQAISAVDDTGMFREWSQDDSFIFGPAAGQDPFHLTIKIKFTKVPPYTAPEILYRTARSMGMNRNVNENYNLTWIFPVDSGFYYLVRLHFCEIAPEITGINQRVFEIFLNNQTADDQMDIMVYADGIGVPIYREFVVMVPEAGGVRQELWLALHPNTGAHAKYSDALLNGLEIFKLNASDGNLAGPNPIPKHKSKAEVDQIEPIQTADRWNKVRKPLIFAGVVVGGVVAVALILFFFILRRLGAKKKARTAGTSRGTSWWTPFSQSGAESTKTRYTPRPSELCRHFSLEEMLSATNDFSDDFLIGVGGFGNVYRGAIHGGATPVAVKRLNPTSQQGTREFRTEIEMLSQLRHIHLVSLIGYCAEHGEMILVYDFMANGALRDHLYGTDNPPLPWKKRLDICIGAAKGLHHLHTGAKHTIIHRDVKTANILLDENWVAKVSDFGLSKLGPAGGSESHVSTVVKGSFGYIDPEYYLLQRLTDKSDVYSFGVVLFEVLCGRPPVEKHLEGREASLVEWGKAHYKSGRLEEIVDNRVRNEIGAECLRKFGEIATSCVGDRGTERPAMGDVMWGLEFAMQLQKKSGEVSEIEEGLEGERRWNGHGGGGGGGGGESTLGMSGDVFSEIRNPQGR